MERTLIEVDESIYLRKPTVTLDRQVRVYISLSSAAHTEAERTSEAHIGEADKAAAHRLWVDKTEPAAQENHP